MTLLEIANELQLLIDRLTLARNLLASLRPESAFDLPAVLSEARLSVSPSAVTTALPPAPRSPRKPRATRTAASPHTTAAATPAKPAATSGPPRRQHRRSTPLPSALRNSVPAGPVAVSAEEVRRKLVTPPAPPPAQRTPTPEPSSGHSLDDLLRELAARQPALLSS